VAGAGNRGTRGVQIGQQLEGQWVFCSDRVGFLIKVGLFFSYWRDSVFLFSFAGDFVTWLFVGRERRV
jgi:hypothetical protein